MQSNPAATVQTIGIHQVHIDKNKLTNMNMKNPLAVALNKYVNKSNINPKVSFISLLL